MSNFFDTIIKLLGIVPFRIGSKYCYKKYVSDYVGKKVKKVKKCKKCELYNNCLEEAGIKTFIPFAIILVYGLIALVIYSFNGGKL